MVLIDSKNNQVQKVRARSPCSCLVLSPPPPPRPPMSLPPLRILGDYQRCHGSLFSIENNIVRAFQDLTSSTVKVKNFLDALMDRPRPFVQSALHTLSLRKQAHLGTSHLPIIQA